MKRIVDEYDSENPFGLETESDFHACRRTMTLSIIKNHLDNKEIANILDVGCGKGQITKLIKQQNKSVIVDAIDISPKAIDYALNDTAGVNYAVANAINFKGYGYLYDVIVLNNIYEHVENPIGILKNLKELLTNEGIIIISTPNRYYIKNILRKLLGLRIVNPIFHITEYSIGQLCDHHLYCDLTIKTIITPKFKRENIKILDIIIFKVLQPLIDIYLILMKSKTRMGSLLFIVSQKKLDKNKTQNKSFKDE